jgi:hypothetical protein
MSPFPQTAVHQHPANRVRTIQRLLDDHEPAFKVLPLVQGVPEDRLPFVGLRGRRMESLRHVEREQLTGVKGGRGYHVTGGYRAWMIADVFVPAEADGKPDGSSTCSVIATVVDIEKDIIARPRWPHEASRQHHGELQVPAVVLAMAVGPDALGIGAAFNAQPEVNVLPERVLERDGGCGDRSRREEFV